MWPLLHRETRGADAWFPDGKRRAVFPSALAHLRSLWCLRGVSQVQGFPLGGPGLGRVAMASITQLFDDLCEALLPAAQARPGQRSVNRKRAKLSLKRVAYNALFANLFQEETHQRQPDSSKLPVKNKVLMLSFDLRVGGLGPEADRLEELVEKLEATPGCPLVEVESVLDLLVQLAGSGPPQVLRRKRDYFFNNKHAGRNVPYSGYDCYDLSVFEMDVRSLISGEEYLCHNMVQEAVQVMEAAPGTGLPTVGLFSAGDSCGDRFERDTRVSLFGALVHSRTCDMDVRLDLPPVPDSADFSGLAIKVVFLSLQHP